MSQVSVFSFSSHNCFSWKAFGITVINFSLWDFQLLVMCHTGGKREEVIV